MFTAKVWVVGFRTLGLRFGRTGLKLKPELLSL